MSVYVWIDEGRGCYDNDDFKKAKTLAELAAIDIRAACTPSQSVVVDHAVSQWTQYRVGIAVAVKVALLQALACSGYSCSILSGCEAVTEGIYVCAVLTQTRDSEQLPSTNVEVFDTWHSLPMPQVCAIFECFALLPVVLLYEENKSFQARKYMYFPFPHPYAPRIKIHARARAHRTHC